jgi:hypothetical protein
VTKVTAGNMSNCRFCRCDDASGYDDRAVTLGLSALALTERPEGRAGGLATRDDLPWDLDGAPNALIPDVPSETVSECLRGNRCRLRETATGAAMIPD